MSRHKTKLAAALIFTAAFCSVSSFAEDEISPARLALAKQVMEVNGSANAYENYDKNLELMVSQVRQAAPGIDDATVAELRKIANEEFLAYKPTLIEGTEKIYAKHFSEDDLRALLAFYKTDAGKHFAAETPGLTAECLQLTAPFSKRIMQRFITYVQSRVAEGKEKK